MVQANPTVGNSALLDACVLYQLPLRDTLLRIASEGVFEPRWTELLLDEMARNLVKNGRSDPAGVERLRRAMETTFPTASIVCHGPVPPDTSPDEQAMLAAVEGRVAFLVTFDIRGFPKEPLRRFGIERCTPDDFLMRCWCANPAGVSRALNAQAVALRRPPMTRKQIVSRLALIAPTFADAVT